MTAVASPLSFQQHRWASNAAGFGGINDDEVRKMFVPGQRKTLPRQNSSSSINSNSSAASQNSTASTAMVQANGAGNATTEAGSWAARKKPTRGIWPTGKAEPATGITTARPQAVSSATSGPTASSAISALHAPLLPSQQMANGTSQANGVRGQAQSEPTAILHLLPMNGTFERKTINVPFAPESVKIGRQTNQKTIPTSMNGYFDSKVLSRQHAQIWADRQGRIFIQDVKSSNGTFVNGMRLSQENKESDPRELREQDVLELGIDIVSEDQKTVVHHKVAAKVEHAGIYAQGNDALTFTDLDPSAGGNMVAGPAPMRRTGSQGSVGRASVNGSVNGGGVAQAALSQPQYMRNWLNPITTEHIVKKLNAEMKLALQQQEDLKRARQSIEAMLAGKEPPVLEKEPKSKSNSDRVRPSPIKSKTDLKAHFSEPPAPPPSAPLPEKPDVARALADPLIQPLLRRADTARPPSASSSPTRMDHSSDILRLCEELKLAKGELSNQSERMKSLETELQHERTARESAEERAQRLEQRRDSPRDSFSNDSLSKLDDHRNDDARDDPDAGPPDLQRQLDRLKSSMDDMKQQMERYRQRAEHAETERDEARQSLADLIEQKRRENAAAEGNTVRPGSSRGGKAPSPTKRDFMVSSFPDKADALANGHALGPHFALQSPPTSSALLLERAGIEDGSQPLTPEQAKMLARFLAEAVDAAGAVDGKAVGVGERGVGDGQGRGRYYGVPTVSAISVLLLGCAVMRWVNAWERVER